MKGLTSVLITGGVRSGKSRFAQELALKSEDPVLFVATAVAGDEEMKRRIEEHRRARPPGWSTLEITTHIGREITGKIGGAKVVIIDCITLLVSNILGQYTDAGGENIDVPGAEKGVNAEMDELVECLNHLDAVFVMVTNEVGAGLVPPNRLGRLYRDLLGNANRMLAQRADEVYLMVAGLPLRIKPLPNSDV